jgi:hypothetical protein
MHACMPRPDWNMRAGREKMAEFRTSEHSVVSMLHAHYGEMLNRPFRVCEGVHSTYRGSFHVCVMAAALLWIGYRCCREQLIDRLINFSP